MSEFAWIQITWIVHRHVIVQSGCSNIACVRDRRFGRVVARVAAVAASLSRGVDAWVERLGEGVWRRRRVPADVVVHGRAVVGIRGAILVSVPKLEAAEGPEGVTFDVAAECQVDQGVGATVDVRQKHDDYKR